MLQNQITAQSKAPVLQKNSSSGKSLPSGPVAQLCGNENEKNKKEDKKNEFWSATDTGQSELNAGVKQLKSSPNFSPIQLKKAINTGVAQLAPFEYSEEEKPMLSVGKLSKNIGIHDGKKEKKEAFKYADSELKEEKVKNIAKNYVGNEEAELGDLEENYPDVDYSETIMGDLEDYYPDVDYSYDANGMEKTQKRVGSDQFVGGRFNENTLGSGSKGYKGSKSDETVDTSKLIHTTGSAAAMGNIENYGIDPSFTRTDNRFGQAYYVTNGVKTSRSELVHHGMKGYHSLEYKTGKEGGGKILDLTQDKSDKVFTEQYPQGVRRHALENKFNGVAYPSQRDDTGVNFAIYNEFNKTIGSRDKDATKTWTDEERESMRLDSQAQG
jgi:hypothetical protein